MSGFYLRGPYFRGSARARLVRLALLLLLPGLAISAILTWRIFVTEREGAEIALSETARGLSQLVDREFVQAEVLLRTLAATEEIRDGNLASFDRLARATLVMGGDIVLVDRSGRELIDTALPPSDQLPIDVPDAGWLQEVPGHAYIAPMDRLPRTGAFAIQVILPVRGAPPGQAYQHLYDLKLIVPESRIEALLMRENLPAGWIAGVLDTANRIVARTANPGVYVGQYAPPDRIGRLLGGEEVVRDDVSLDGRPVVVALCRSAQTGWVVSANEPRQLIAQAGRQSTWLLVWMGSVAIILGLMGALHVARGIARRIEAMAEAARQLGESEAWRPIPPGLDEADEVARAMAAAASTLIERRDALSELNATLAARVEARTAELAEANRALEDQRRQLGMILDQMPIGVVVHHADGGLLIANVEARRLMNLPSGHPVHPGNWPPMRRGTMVLAEADRPEARACAGIVTERALLNLELPNGRQLDLEVNAGPLRDSQGRVVLGVTTLQDVTARLEAEETRRRSQRLEVVGQLTGGVAHEFNNLLMAISGCLELLTPHVQSGRGPRFLENAARATQRGGRLTRQLLAFSRRQHLQPEPVDLNALVSGMTELLESTLGRTVEVGTSLAPDAWPAMADASQLELVLLNLAINARDAMPGGGRLTIRTANARTGPPIRAEDPPEGEHAVLNVSDTGEGMPPQVLARAFEPFFTTKEVGLGSGLGLPQVLGVAQQLGGGVTIASQPGHGTTVRVFLPRALATPSLVPKTSQKTRAHADMLLGARLLLVDDDADVRSVAREMLIGMGATVTEADSAAAALLHLRTGGATDLVLADLTMPQVTGVELAEEIASFLPDLPIVLMTGYGAATIGDPGPHIRALLQKPFRADSLARTLAKHLGRDIATPDLEPSIAHE